MTISEAIRAVSDDYDEEVLHAKSDRSYHELMTRMMEQEYDEIDQERT